MSSGQDVEFEFEVPAGGQDAFAYRAVRVYPLGAAVVDLQPPAGGERGAYSSGLHLRWGGHSDETDDSDKTDDSG